MQLEPGPHPKAKHNSVWDRTAPKSKNTIQIERGPHPEEKSQFNLDPGGTQPHNQIQTGRTRTQYGRSEVRTSTGFDTSGLVRLRFLTRLDTSGRATQDFLTRFDTSGRVRPGFLTRFDTSLVERTREVARGCLGGLRFGPGRSLARLDLDVFLAKNTWRSTFSQPKQTSHDKRGDHSDHIAGLFFDTI